MKSYIVDADLDIMKTVLTGLWRFRGSTYLNVLNWWCKQLRRDSFDLIDLQVGWF